MMALRDKTFQADLMLVLKGTKSGFKADKGYEQLDELIGALDGLSLITISEKATTKDMFDAVLDMPGTKFKVHPKTGRIEGETPVTFRQELTASIKDFGDEDEDVQDEERPDEMNLGNISFLYELAKPNPEDPGDLEISPETPRGFWAKMGRLNERAKELRIDLNAWEKEQNKLPPEDRKPAPGVYLGTVHSVKGAQWPHVYVQMPNGRFPMEPPRKDGEQDEPMTPDEIAEQAAELEGERRLAYVALTRPSKTLRIVAPGQYQGKPAGMSRFLDEAGLTLGENVPRGAEAPKTAAFFVEDADNVFSAAGGL
jgi:superfamily I DNA/RNA helicase